MSAGDTLTDYEKQILANADEFGVHVTSVSADPAFTYSAGFERSFDRPEAITFGLGYETMASMINRLRDAYADGMIAKDGLRLDGILNHFPVVVREIPRERIVRDYFNSAIWLHRRNAGEPLTRAVQIVWPCDETGLFPWDTGCPEDVIAAQPPLYSTSLN